MLQVKYKLGALQKINIASEVLANELTPFKSYAAQKQIKHRDFGGINFLTIVKFYDQLNLMLNYLL